MQGLYENICFFLILSPESIKKLRELYFTLYNNGGYVTMSFQYPMVAMRISIVIYSTP